MSFQLESLFETTLTQELTNAQTVANVSAVPLTITSGVILIGDDDNEDNWETSYFDGVSSLTLTFSSINQRGLNKDATSTTDSTSTNRKTHNPGTKVRIVDSHLYFNDKASLTEANSFAEDQTIADTKKVYLGGGTTAYIGSDNTGLIVTGKLFASVKEALSLKYK
jgi:hypothetical protein